MSSFALLFYITEEDLGLRHDYFSQPNPLLKKYICYWDGNIYVLKKNIWNSSM